VNTRARFNVCPTTTIDTIVGQNGQRRLCTHAMGWYGPPALTEPVQLIGTCAAPVLAVLIPGGAVKLLAYASAAILHTVLDRSDSQES
jgi:hypothetical protein